jgi:hypothetical protein
MSVESGEVSDSVVDPRNSYNPETLANEVIWPLVNYIWTCGTGTDDWRRDAVAEEDMINTFRRGRHKGRNFRAELAASLDAEIEIDDEEEFDFPLDLYDDEDDDTGFEIPYMDTVIRDDENDGKPIARATFYLREVVMGQTRHAIIDMARLALQAKTEASPEHEEQILLAWPTGDDESLTVATERSYTFCADGYWGYTHRITIDGDNQDRMSLPFDSANEAVEDDKLRLADVEAFEAICAVFNAPAAIKQALGCIKSDPVPASY